MQRRRFLVATIATGILPIPCAWAEDYPTRPIKLIVPFAPGGSADYVARLIAAPLTRELGQTVVIENKTGAGGAIGTMEAVRAPADGYTLLMVTPSVTAASPAINPNTGYDPINDLTPIINVAAGPTVLAVNPKFPAQNYQEFVAELKRNPERYSYASPGVGGILHLHVEQFKNLTNTSIVHVPFRGAGPALVAAAGGQVDIIEDALPSMLPALKDGRLRPIVLSAPERRKELPDVPTFAEVGLEPLNYMGHWGIMGPKGLAQEIVEKVNAAGNRAVQEPETKQRIEESGAVVVGGSPQEFGTEIKEIFTHLKQVVIDRKLTLE